MWSPAVSCKLVVQAASPSSIASAVPIPRRLSASRRTEQCAAGITFFFSNVLYQAVIVVLFDGESNGH
jgi:hypothetical protein